MTSDLHNGKTHRLPVGVDDFKELREECYFVDKTRFIRSLIDERSKITLITRPRRFGKTLTLSMLYYFFTNRQAEANSKLFVGTDIFACGDRYKAEQGKRPVIFLTLHNAKQQTSASMVQRIGRIMSEVYKSFSYLLSENSPLDAGEQAYYRRICAVGATGEELEDSLRALSEYLYRYHNKKTVILLDEYDVPVQQGWQYHFHADAVAFMRNFMGAALKSNNALDFAVITGVLRIARESIFSALNNLEISSVVQGRFADVMGFTQTEVEQMALELGVSNHIPEIKHWYDGYTFSGQEIYNPWSVINYFQQGCLPQIYWLNTSDNAIIGELMANADNTDDEKLLALLQGESVEVLINEAVIYSDIYTDKDALYTMLLAAGYLKAVTNRLEDGEHICDLAIPNREIATVYRKEILNRYRGSMTQSDLHRVLGFLLQGQAKEFADGLQNYLVQMVSFHDTGGKESFYHGFVLGLTAWLMPKYIVKSNRESGHGRFDLGIFPKQAGQVGIIMEFKVASEEGKLRQAAQTALEQIDKQDYMAEFRAHNIKSVWKYGIAFCGKKLELVCGQ